MMDQPKKPSVISAHGKPQRPQWTPSLHTPTLTQPPHLLEITLVARLQNHPFAATQRAHSGNSTMKTT